MADEEKVVFGLDLDADSFKKGLEDISKAFEKIGDLGDGSIKTLASGFAKLAPTIAIAAAAVYGLKTAYEKAFEGEQVLLAYKQFNNLAESAGLAGEQILQGMEKASGGLVGGVEMIKIANEAIVKMGASAERLPEIMDLARKASVLFGGTVEENFEKLSSSMAAMQARGLRQYGIIVDTTKAQKDYAKSIGATTDSLTAEGKQHAFINASLDAAKEKYKNVQVNNDSMNATQQRTKVLWSELGEAISIMTSKVFGPFFTMCLKGFDSVLESSRKFLILLGGGTEAQQAEVKLKSIGERIATLNESIATMKEKQESTSFGKFMSAGIEKRIAVAREEITKLNTQAETLKATLEKKGPEGSKGGGDVDYEKLKQDEDKFEKEKIAIQKDSNEKSLSISESRGEVDQLMDTKMLLAAQDYESKKKILEDRYKDGKIASREQLNAALLSLDTANAAEQIKLTQQVEDAERQADNNAERYSKQTGDAMSASIRNAARSASGDLKMIQATSKNAFGAFQSNATKALQAWGSGSAKASEAVKMFFLGALGDMATKQGEFMMLDAWTTYPAVKFPEMAAGAALIALGGALGASKSGGTSPGGGGDTGGGAVAGASTTGASDPAAQQKKTLTMNIHGNLFNTSETQRTLVDMMKSELDVTDYKVSTVT